MITRCHSAICKHFLRCFSFQPLWKLLHAHGRYVDMSWRPATSNNAAVALRRPAPQGRRGTFCLASAARHFISRCRAPMAPSRNEARRRSPCGADRFRHGNFGSIGGRCLFVAASRDLHVCLASRITKRINTQPSLPRLSGQSSRRQVSRWCFFASSSFISSLVVRRENVVRWSRCCLFACLRCNRTSNKLLWGPLRARVVSLSEHL